MRCAPRASRAGSRSLIGRLGRNDSRPSDVGLDGVSSKLAGEFSAPLAVARHRTEGLRDVPERPRTMGNRPRVDRLASSLQRSDVTRIRQQFNSRVSASLSDGGTAPNRLRDALR